MLVEEKYQRWDSGNSAWDNMYDGITTDECGEDVGDNLTDGDTVSESWIDGVSDWWVDNHPITVCVGDSATWNGGEYQLSPVGPAAQELVLAGGLEALTRERLKD